MVRRLSRMTSTDKLCVALALVVVLACLFAYGRSLDGPLFFDDVPNLTDNTLLKIDGRDFDDWRVAAINSESGLFQRPVAMLTFAANYVIAGDFFPSSLKGTNLAVHLMIGVLIYFLCKTLLQAPVLSGSGLGNSHILAMAASAIWLLHPLHVSTVLYAIQRMAQLSTLFTLLGILVYARYRLRWAEAGAATGELIAAGVWLILVAFLAVLSKENGALLVWLIVVVEVTLFGGMWNGRRSSKLYKASCVVLLAPVIMVALMLLCFPETLAARYSGREFSLQERLYTQGRVLWQYLGWILLPNVTSLGFFHDDIPKSHGLLSPYTTAVALVAWLGVLATALALRKVYPLLLFALLFYLVAHSMESTIIPLEMVFEHRNYLPSVGISLLMAVAVYQLAARFKGLRFRFALGIVLGLLFAQLLIRTNAWTDAMTLAHFNVINHPASPRANFFYGNELFEKFALAELQGLTAEEQKALAVGARHYFVRSHELDDRSFAPLVMLYQLDTLHFPALAEENNWLAKLEELAETKRLQASDRTALGALVDFSLSYPAGADRVRVGDLVDNLAVRFPRRMDLVTLQYRLKVSERGVDREALRNLLQDAVQTSPRNRQLYAYLIQYHGSDDTAATYEYIKNWMQLDTHRRELQLIRRIVEN